MSPKRTPATRPETLGEEQLESVSGGMNKGELIEWLYAHEAEAGGGAPAGSGVAAGITPRTVQPTPRSLSSVAKKASDG